MCICCPCGAFHRFQPLLPFLLGFTCVFQLVRSSFAKVLCLATNRPQGCMWSRRGTETTLMRLTISFKMGYSLHVTNCWRTRLLSTAEESLYFSLQTKVAWKVQNFPWKSLSSSVPQEPAWPCVRCWKLQPQLSAGPWGKLQWKLTHSRVPFPGKLIFSEDL